MRNSKPYRLLGLFVSVVILPGCSFLAVQNEAQWSSVDAGSPEPRMVVVLFDGTRNSPSSKTNVSSMNDAFRSSGKRAVVDYIPGVGTATGTQALGAILGFTMEEGVQKGYRFLSANARPQDKILIFGFSRGAHQARSLAGLVAYAGLIDQPSASQVSLRHANKVIEAIKPLSDATVGNQFSAAPNLPPAKLGVEAETGFRMRTAAVDFLGLWDTVPGSSFKDYGDCRELSNSAPGDRYKTGSYPLVRHIAHAVALDEKRSKYNPLLVCAPIIPSKTVVNEVWFAGAHADVGGGYTDGELQSISLDWMVDQARDVTTGRLPVAPPGSPLGLAHWSFGSGPASFGSECSDRRIPPGAQMHHSVAERVSAGRAEINLQGNTSIQPYPRRCDPN